MSGLESLVHLLVPIDTVKRKLNQISKSLKLHRRFINYGYKRRENRDLRREKDKGQPIENTRIQSHHPVWPHTDPKMTNRKDGTEMWPLGTWFFGTALDLVATTDLSHCRFPEGFCYSIPTFPLACSMNRIALLSTVIMMQGRDSLFFFRLPRLTEMELSFQDLSIMSFLQTIMSLS